tara:strand:- start:318 stop:659 length:342 start_codon:yes stop_codon:yes gene_type:complete
MVKKLMFDSAVEHLKKHPGLKKSNGHTNSAIKVHEGKTPGGLLGFGGGVYSSTAREQDGKGKGNKKQATPVGTKLKLKNKAVKIPHTVSQILKGGGLVNKSGIMYGYKKGGQV